VLTPAALRVSRRAHMKPILHLATLLSTQYQCALQVVSQARVCMALSSTAPKCVRSAQQARMPLVGPWHPASHVQQMHLSS
jgi:hypothetical protein